MIFCQFSNCPQKGEEFETKEMINFKDLHFCSSDCQSSFYALNENLLKASDIKKYENRLGQRALEYLEKGFTPVQALRKAGYSASSLKSARKIANRLLKKYEKN